MYIYTHAFIHIYIYIYIYKYIYIYVAVTWSGRLRRSNLSSSGNCASRSGTALSGFGAWETSTGAASAAWLNSITSSSSSGGGGGCKKGIHRAVL